MTKEEFIELIKHHKKSTPWLREPKDWIEYSNVIQEYSPKLSEICRQLAKAEQQYLNHIDLVLDQVSFENEIECDKEANELIAKYSSK